MSDSAYVPLTFDVHPLLVPVVKPIIKKLIQPDSEGEQYRGLASPWAECRWPPVHSYEGDIFRLDLIGPVSDEGAQRAYSGGYMRSDAYALQLGQTHATELARIVRIVCDNSVGVYAANHQLYLGR